MREIKFRGRNRISGDWNFGYLTSIKSLGFGISIKNPINGVTAPVNPDTVGQFTGKKDKHGNEIHEGDFLLHEVKGNKFIHLVRWNENEACFESSNRICFMYPQKLIEAEVIGNIFDTPSLKESL